VAEVQPSGASRKMDLKPLEGLGHVAAAACRRSVAATCQPSAARSSRSLSRVYRLSALHLTTFVVRTTKVNMNFIYKPQATLCSLTNYNTIT